MHLADTVYYIQPGEEAISDNGRFRVKCEEGFDEGDLIYCFDDLELFRGRCMQVARGRIMQKFQSVLLQPQGYYEQAYRIKGADEIGTDTTVSG